MSLFAGSRRSSLELDPLLEDDVFEFVAPPGEEIRSPRGDAREVQHHISIARAQELAAVHRLVTERLPSSSKVHCTLPGPSQRPPAGPWIHINYRSDSGREDLSVSECAHGDRDYPDTDGPMWEDGHAGARAIRVLRTDRHGPGQCSRSKTTTRPST